MSGTDPTPMDKDSSGRDPPPITSATCLAAHREPRARMTAIVRFEPSMLRARTQDSAMLSYGSPESVELQGGDHEKSNLRHHLSREASDQAAHQDGATVMRERGEGDGG